MLNNPVQTCQHQTSHPDGDDWKLPSSTTWRHVVGYAFTDFSGEFTCPRSRSLGPSETLTFQSSLFFLSSVSSIGHNFSPVYAIDLQTGTTSSHISVDKENQLDVTFVFFISLLPVAQHVSGNHVPIIRSWRLRDVIASCWYVPWLQGGCQVRLAGSASMDGFVIQPHIRFQVIYSSKLENKIVCSTRQ